MSKNYIQYTSRIKSSTADGILIEADQIKDEAEGKLQSVINQEMIALIAIKANAADVYKKNETYTKGEVDTKVANAIVGAYHTQGSKDTFAEVLAITDARVGDVWNINTKFTYGGKEYDAGTNVVCIKDTSASSHTEANWDPLGGINDMSAYSTTEETNVELEKKVDKVDGKSLSTNDYTTDEKKKLAGIAPGAQVNSVTSVAGKTGAVTLSKSDVGLPNVDNTSDEDKPVSTAAQEALNLKANTADVYKKNETYTRIEVDTKVAAAIVGAYHTQGSKNTFAEVLALTNAKVGDVWNVKEKFTYGGKEYEAGTNVVCIKDTSASSHTEANWDPLGGINDMSAYSTTEETNVELDKKVDKVDGKGLSTNDYTTDEKKKLGNVPKYTFGAPGNPGQMLTVSYEESGIKLNFGGKNTASGAEETWPYTVSAANAERAGVMSAEDYQALMDAKPMALIGLANITTSSTSDEIKKMLNVETMSELFAGIFKGRRVVELTDMNMRRDVTCSLVPDVAYQGNFLATFSVIVADQYNQIDQKIYTFNISPRNNSCSLRDLKTVNLYTLSSRVAAIEDAVTLQ